MQTATTPEAALQELIRLAQPNWRNSAKFAEQYDISALYPVTRREIKTIGMFYHGVGNGGVERVISLLTPIFMDMGYRVVIITDEPPTENDYSFPIGVERVVLDDGPCWVCRDYPARAAKWQACIREHHIDAVIYHAWLAASLFWDMAVIKSTGAAFIVHSHGVFTVGLVEGQTWVQDSEALYAHADAICVLSKADQLYWQRCNHHVFLVQNPNTLTEHPPEKAPATSCEVLWLARFNQEKNPEDALHIMQRVIRQVPQARLTMVGHMSHQQRAHFIQLIEQLGLSHCVMLPGYSKNVAEYYSRAHIYLSTSNYEGAPMTFAESFSNHVPIVCYPQPYLSILEHTDGAISVPWKDFDAAADTIVRLLQDPHERNHRSAAAGAKFRELAAFDYPAQWRTILAAALSAEPAGPQPISHETFAMFTDTVNLITRQMAMTMKEEKRAAEEAQNQIYQSLRYRIGKAVLWLPTKLAQLLRRG